MKKFNNEHETRTTWVCNRNDSYFPRYGSRCVTESSRVLRHLAYTKRTRFASLDVVTMKLYFDVYFYILLCFSLFLILSFNVFELTDFEHLSDPAACPNYCGRVYSGAHRKFNLKKHLRFECNVAPMFLCGICSRKFSRNDNLKRHLILVHKTLENPAGMVDDGNGGIEI